MMACKFPYLSHVMGADASSQCHDPQGKIICGLLRRWDDSKHRNINIMAVILNNPTNGWIEEQRVIIIIIKLVH